MKPDTTLEDLCAVAASYLFLKEELFKAQSACDVAQKNLDLKILAFKKAEALCIDTERKISLLAKKL